MSRDEEPQPYVTTRDLDTKLDKFRMEMRLWVVIALIGAPLLPMRDVASAAASLLP